MAPLHPLVIAGSCRKSSPGTGFDSASMQIPRKHDNALGGGPLSCTGQYPKRAFIGGINSGGQWQSWRGCLEHDRKRSRDPEELLRWARQRNKRGKP